MIEIFLSVVVSLPIAVFTYETAKRIFRNVTLPSLIDTVVARRSIMTRV